MLELFAYLGSQKSSFIKNCSFFAENSNIIRHAKVIEHAMTVLYVVKSSIWPQKYLRYILPQFSLDEKNQVALFLCMFDINRKRWADLKKFLISQQKHLNAREL